MTEQDLTPTHSEPSTSISDAQVDAYRDGIIAALEDKKALDVSVLDLRSKSTMADYFIVCSGNSKTHTRALAEAAYHYVKEQQLHVYSLEGKQEGSWVLLDIGFIVIHVMQESQREFYNLEQLWTHARSQEKS